MSEQTEKDDSKTPCKGKYKKAYCIFENCYGHASTFCLNTKLTHEQKMAKAKREKVCMICLKTVDHKEKDCDSKYKSCLICGAAHNVNLHSRKDVSEALKKRKQQAKSD